MRSLIAKIMFTVFIALLFAGCATSRGIVSIQIPEAGIAPQPNGKTIFIRSVTDARVFEQKPKSPDIPSLGFGGADTASVDLKKRAIARKRNGYGRALGDILLEENESVESVMKDSLTRSFSEIGYAVIKDKANLKPDTVIVDASIEKFWSWMNLGFWSITLNSEIGTRINVSNQDKPKNIYVKSEGHYQIANEKNWLDIMKKSLQQYNEKVKEEFSAKVQQ